MTRHPTPTQTRILRTLAEPGGAIIDDYASGHALMVGEQSHGPVRCQTIVAMLMPGWIVRNGDQLRYEITDAGRAAARR